MTSQEFFDKYNGKYIDYDGYYGYQCVDLYRQFVKEVYGCQQSPPISGAAKVWDTYNKDFFTRISNGPVNYPNRGDIVIWNTKAGGGYGHIAIAMDAASMSFNSFDQNWPTGSRCHKQPHNYTNVLGWLTPKKKEDNIVSTGPTPTTETIPQPEAEAPIPTEVIPSVDPTPSPEPIVVDTPSDVVLDSIPEVVSDTPTTTNGSSVSASDVIQVVSEPIQERITLLQKFTVILDRILKWFVRW